MKNKWMIIVIILVVLAVIGTTVGVSLAVWRSRPVTEQDVPLPIDDYNPSEKHFVYHALDASGNFTNGTASSYAVVGYDGLVDILEIPSTYEGKAVTKIMFDESNVAYRFSGSQVIRQLIIPASVVYIADGSFTNCVYLQSVTIRGSGELYVGSAAFAGCTSLTSFIYTRPITSDGSYLFGTPLA